MNLAHLHRRKRFIDDNETAQDKSWADETAWINAFIDALQGTPTATKVSDVLLLRQRTNSGWRNYTVGAATTTVAP